MILRYSKNLKRLLAVHGSVGTGSLHLYRVVQKMSSRLRELAPCSVASSRNLADIFLDIPVLLRVKLGLVSAARLSVN